MENMPNGKRPRADGAACTPGTTTPMNRWATLVSVLTGTIENFSCMEVDRKSEAFRKEYSIGGVDPYDYRYNVPFHRLISNGCTAGPGTLLPTWFGWSPTAIKYHDANDP